MFLGLDGGVIIGRGFFGLVLMGISLNVDGVVGGCCLIECILIWNINEIGKIIFCIL